jgi:uncharacterized membrane protein
MDARAKLLGHPIHQTIIVLPLGLLVGAILFDIGYLIFDNARLADTAFWAIGLGVICALVAAVFGLIDWTKIPWGTRAKRIGLMHAGANVTAVILFAISWLVRWDEPMQPTALAFALAWIGGALGLVGGWLGGELVDRLGIGVHEGAHLDAPNSMSARPAAEHATT